MLSAARKKKLLEFLNILNIESENLEIFDIALTHPSYNFEANKENMPDYERLEFLGDSVLRLAVSNLLFEKFPNFDEGKLTKIRSCLVSDEFLAQIALNFNMPKYLNIGIHEAKDGGRIKESILACAMEAVFAAVYISCSYDKASKFISEIYEKTQRDFTEILYSYNSKEILQQYTQSKNKDLPFYEIINEFGQDHDKIYEARVSYENKVLGFGAGKTKKEAEKKAALEAIKKLNLI